MRDFLMHKPWTFFTSAPVYAGIVSFALSFPASAALIGVDWQTAGDSLLVRDTTTNLEWLKLTETTGMTYGAVSGQLGTGGSFEGLRYATNAEVINLFSDYFGIALGPSDYYGETPAYLDPGVRLASEALGTGVSGGTDEFSGPNANYILIGYTGEAMTDESQFVLGARTRWSDTDYFSARDPLPLYAAFYATDTSFDLVRGSYLVRTAVVPLPAAAWLFGSGLLGVMALTRRKVA